MAKSFNRRHSFWYEQLLFSAVFQFVAGFIVVVLLPNWLNWEGLLSSFSLTGVRANTLFANSFAYVFSFFILHKFKRFPGTQSLPFVMPTVLVSWLLVFSVFLLSREIEYSRPVLLGSFTLAVAWSFFSIFLSRRFFKPKLALVPFGRALELADTPHALISVLENTDISHRRYDGIVADLHAEDLPDEWERFLARCTLSSIPVYHTQQLIEAFTGRVRIDHLSENSFGSLQPSVLYSALKRLVDFACVFLLSPIFIPIMLVTAVLIKLDRKGAVFYTQQRMGFRGKAFTMYKFRSMRNDIKGKGFTNGESDPRITNVGTVIRKYRIDELPQILNVLKGEMSFIGPRPESLELSIWYEKDVPFFSYRHIVRPGLSGWAQVNQGYAAEVEGMIVKLQYDFYYIKNFSLLLDILIVSKTIRTILTGFGSR